MDIRKSIYITYIFIFNILLSACYHEKSKNDSDFISNDTTVISDTLSFYTKHHYTIGYNFLVRNDSLILIAQQPEEHVSQLVIDTFCIKHDKQIAVSDIRIIPQDSVDSVWIQVITEDGRIGWNHETEMLRSVVPTDPISQFIMMFSDAHLIIAIIILALIATAYIARTIQKRNAPIVHLRDIPSPYPTLLCIIVAFSATLYASLQMFGADTWQHFYYHPSLNPFSMPLILGVFISSVWAMLIISLAVLEDVHHHLNLEDTFLYLLGLCGVCSILYIIFSISTLYYIGYPLLIAYCWFAIKSYQRNSQSNLACGNCGRRIQSKGRCPHCGAINE